MSAPHVYHLHFKVRRHPGFSEHTRVCQTAEPIEYADDIDKACDWAAIQIGVESTDVLMIAWTKLTGTKRPGEEK